MWLQRLNPFNTLFGRIFLWFWIAMLVVIISTVFVARQIANEKTLRPIKPNDQTMLDYRANKLQEISQRHPQIDLQRILNRMRILSRTDILLIRLTDHHMITADQRKSPPNVEIFTDLLNQPSVFSINLPGIRFIGPKNVTINNQQYALFIGRPLPPHFFRPFHHQPPWLLLASAVIISGLLCFFLSWSLVKPLQRLRNAAVKMAAGDLSSRSGESSYRHDEIGQLSREFDQMAAKLEKLMTGQKRMLADISHELRSPLARLQMAVGLIQQQQSLPQLARIETEARRMDAMLGEILMLSKLNSQLQPLDCYPLNLQECLQALLDDARFEANNSGKTLHIKIAPSVTVIAEEGLLCRAIENLLRNAIKYARQHIHVTISHTDDNQANISICDDGEGIPVEDIDKIFLPFYRTATSRSRHSGGVGLGLAIAQSAINRFHGEIQASLATNGGLCATISLPAQTA